jgi:uncharacterized membrane protein (DUF373 family)
MLPPVFLLSISDILATFGAFLAVLIAIEIFINITIYIRNDVLPVKLVVATALMAISRKVIILTLKSLLQCIFSQQRLLYWHLELHIG